MNLLDFYLSLPTIEQFPQSSLYITGYTEALRTYQGVRVVPDPSYFEGISQLYEPYLKSLRTPYYFIPITRNNNCYGFVVKGADKKTPSIKSNHYLPGYNQVKKFKPVLLLEGIKDTYLPRKAGIVALPLLTSGVGSALLNEAASLNSPVIFCPDNDNKREQSIINFRKKAATISGLVFYIYMLSGLKDLGDFFLPQYRELALQHTKKLVSIYRKLEVLNG